MPIKVYCPGCNKKLRVPDVALGKKVRCPVCGTAVPVEGPPQMPPASPAVPEFPLDLTPQPGPVFDAFEEEPEVAEPVHEAFEAEPDPPARPRPVSRRDRPKAPPYRKPGFFARLFGAIPKRTPEERAYYRRIALDPDNAALRLELAEYLEGRGDPLGEFMRLDLELMAMPEDDRPEEMDARWGDLLLAHGKEWYAGLKKLGLLPNIGGRFIAGMWMTHGVIDEVTIDKEGVLPQRADQLFAAAPGLRILEFHGTRTDVYFGRLTKDSEYRPNVKAIVALPHLKQISRIKLSSLGLNADHMRLIADSPNLENLAELDCNWNHIGPEGAEYLAQSSGLKRLRVLELYSCDLAEEGAVFLAESPNLARLATLNIGSNAIGPGGAAALARSPHLRQLQKLELGDNQIGPDGAAALASSPHLRALTYLDLNRNELGAEGVEALAGSPLLATLTTLKLNDNQLGGAGAASLAGSPHLGQVTVLELEMNEIDDAGAIALARSAGIRWLEEFSIGYNGFGDEGLKALAAWPALVVVKKLNLAGNQIGAAGVKALAASPALREVKELTLSSNAEIGPEGALALARSPYLEKIEYLFVSDAGIDAEGEEALRERFGDKVSV